MADVPEVYAECEVMAEFATRGWVVEDVFGGLPGLLSPPLFRWEHEQGAVGVADGRGGR